MRNIILALVVGAAVLVTVPAAAATGSADPPTPTGTMTAVHPHAATVGCTWEACIGQDPFQMGCENDAIELELSLYYSPSCEAAWSFAVANSLIGDDTLSTYWEPPQGGPESEFYVIPSTTQNNHTTMVSWNSSVKSCWVAGFTTPVPADPFPEGGQATDPTQGPYDGCTDWY